MNRMGFIILSILRQSGATNKLRSMTVREIAAADDDMGMMENTVYKKIRDFEHSGYVDRGLKEGRADTFFITPDGLEMLERERA